MRRFLLLTWILLAVSAQAQVDDDLPALPTNSKPKHPKPKPKPKTVKKPPPVLDDDLPSLPTQRGELAVKLATQLKGAKLFIDEREVGVLPMPAQTLTVGEHSISVKRLGYSSFTRKVVISSRKPQEIVVALEASAGVLNVVTVAGAQLLINGQRTGGSAVSDYEVPPGSVELRVKKEGFEDGVQVLQVRAGREYPVELKLGPAVTVAAAPTPSADAPIQRDVSPPLTSAMPMPVAETRVEEAPITKRWWFWTGAAVLAVGIGVGVGLAVNQVASQDVFPKKAKFSCGNNCSGWVNEPPAVVPLR